MVLHEIRGVWEKVPSVSIRFLELCISETESTL